jgi:hypothetical protein
MINVYNYMWSTSKSLQQTNNRIFYKILVKAKKSKKLCTYVTIVSSRYSSLSLFWVQGKTQEQMESIMDLLSGPWDQTVVRMLLKFCTASVQARRPERKKNHHLRKPFLVVTDLYKNENHTKICFRKELDLSVLPSRDRFLANPFASLKAKTNKQTKKVPILEHLATMRR